MNQVDDLAAGGEQARWDSRLPQSGASPPPLPEEFPTEFEVLD